MTALGPPAEAVRQTFQLPAFYQKCVMVGDLPVVGSTNVSDQAVREAGWILQHMLPERPDILRTIASNHVRVAVMAWNEFTTDIPEHSRLQSKVYWDRRARGLGATPDAPAVSCAEENLLGFPTDPYTGENILIHEFAHTIHEVGLGKLDPSFDGRLQAAYRRARQAGLWTNTYAASNHKEYWAEGTQSWFDSNTANGPQHNEINTRSRLKRYDPALAALCAEVYGDLGWRYRRPTDRRGEERAHLAGFDFGKAPRFRWRQAPLGDVARVAMTTDAGDILLELYPKQAPVTVGNFLHYVLEGYYNNGAFHRAVRQDNQPDKRIKIEVVQAAADKSLAGKLLPPIRLERTRDTGLKHLEGTLSMARDGPDSAQDEFFICLGEQPELDYGGKRNPDGQGFAAFGKVVRGMDVVRKIQASPSKEQILTPPIRIRRAIRIE